MRGRVGFMGRRVREGTCCLHAGTGAREGIWRLHGDLWASEGTACLKHRGAVRGRVIFMLVRGYRRIPNHTFLGGQKVPPKVFHFYIFFFIKKIGVLFLTLKKV